MAQNGKLRLVSSSLALTVMVAFQGFTLEINRIAAPWIMQSFHLNQSGLARLFAWISVSSVGALVLSRLSDRIGRGWALRWCVIATSLSAIGAALSRNMVGFILCEISLNAASHATVAGAIVVVAEKLPTADRAVGQSLVGIAARAGSGLCIALMPLLVYAGYSWRWLLVLAGLSIISLRLIKGAYEETTAWQLAHTNRFGADNAVSDLLRIPYRRPAIALALSALLSTIAITSAKNWIYFYTVSVVGTPPAAASVMLLIAGGLALTGFPLGAASCERLGRVPTVSGSALLLAIGAAWSFWGPPSKFRHPLLWLGTGFCCFGLGTNAASVGTNSSSTELFPNGLRATMIGCLVLAGAVGTVTGQSVVAALAPRLGVSNVVGYLGLLGIPVSLLFVLFVEESRGLPLKEAASE